MSGPEARARRWWIAFLLNAFLPPAGYAYLGRWKTAAVFLGVVVIGAIGVTEWTLAHPPGVYAAGNTGLLPIGWLISIVLGSHAAWLAGRSAAKRGSRFGHALSYVGVFAVVLCISFGFRAFWPHSVYVSASDSMSPSLTEGDLVAVNGARALCGHAMPKPGDIVIYRRGNSPVRYMHRVVAGPGQTVSLSGGRLAIDGKPIEAHALGTIRHGYAMATIYRERLPNGASYLTFDLGPDGMLDTVA
ncbi:MAG: signal peptidase I, partial [Caulobacteraceae bacterium]